MAYTLKQLTDIEAIEVLKHRYFRGIDTADMELLSGLFTEDVFVEYLGGTYRVQLTGRANMLEFLANSFHAQVMAMHHGHMPEITLTGPDTAEGIWYLEDIFIDLEKQEHTFGTAIYRDVYRREDGVWKMARTVYQRIMEVIEPLHPGARYTVSHLATHGRKPEERVDISHLITWDEV
jgi:SnoaL-like domain